MKELFNRVFRPMEILVTGFIRVSDYNTKGMKYEEGNTDSPFYAFVRSAGVTVKEDTSAGGSFGFGKLPTI